MLSLLMQWLINPRRNPLARLRKYGLRYDDLCEPYHGLDIKEALARLPREVFAARELAGEEANVMKARFEKWMAEQGRTYKDEAEKARRFEIFRSTAKYVDASNAVPGRTYELGTNMFADLTVDEFAANYTMRNLSENILTITDKDKNNPIQRTKAHKFADLTTATAMCDGDMS